MKYQLFLFLSLIIQIFPLQSLLHDLHTHTKITIGQPLSCILLKNTENKSMEIPEIGKKVVIVFYTDPDCKDINDALSEAIGKGGFKDKIAGIGISNCADSWIPDAIIMKGALKKEKQFPGSVLLIDQDHLLSREWGLGNCNNTSIVIVLGQDRKIRYFKYIKSEEESIKSIPEVIGIIDKEMN